MPKKFLVSIDLNRNELQSAVVHPLSAGATPSTPKAGQIYYDVDAQVLKLYNGTAWNALTTGTSGLSSLNGFGSGATANIYGTTNQISVSTSGTTTGSITLSLPTGISLTSVSATNFYGTLIGNASSVTNGVYTTSTGVVTSAMITDNTIVDGDISPTANIAVSKFSASQVTIGSTTIGLGTTATSIGGLTAASATNFYGSLNGQATLAISASNSASLNNLPASSYALLASPQFTGTVNLGANIATGSTTYSSSAGSLLGFTSSNYALLSSANFTAASVGGIPIATTNYVNTTAWNNTSGSVGYAGTANTANTATTATNATNATNATTATNVAGATSAATNSAYMVRDASGRAQVTDPSVAADIATKNYVDNIAQGLNAHDAVGYSTITALPSSTYTNGSSDASGGLGIGASITATANGILTIDGFSPKVNERLLVKDQASTIQNGVYSVSSSGTAGTTWSLVRAVDADNSTAGEMATGDFFYVVGGTTLGGTTWVNSSGSPTGTTGKTIKIGTDNVTFGQISGPGTYLAGNGLTLTGKTFTVNTSSAFSVTSGSIAFTSGPAPQSATGLSTSGSFYYGIQKVVATIIGTGSTNSWNVSHPLNTQDIIVQVYGTGSADTGAEVLADIVRPNSSSVTVSFATAPTSGQNYNVVIIG